MKLLNTTISLGFNLDHLSLQKHGVNLKGFNGKEKDDELKGSGNSYDFGARMYDSRIGKWMKPDKYEGYYSSISPYAFGLNNPIFFIDHDGNKIWDPINNKEVIVTYEDNKAVFKLQGGGEVSQEFLDGAKPVFDIWTSSQVGREMIEQ